MRKEKGGCRQACPLFSFVLSGFNRLRPMFWKFLSGLATCTLPGPLFVVYALLGLAERNGSGLSVESAEELPESVTCVVRGLIKLSSFLFFPSLHRIKNYPFHRDTRLFLISHNQHVERTTGLGFDAAFDISLYAKPYSR